VHVEYIWYTYTDAEVEFTQKSTPNSKGSETQNEQITAGKDHVQVTHRLRMRHEFHSMEPVRAFIMAPTYSRQAQIAVGLRPVPQQFARALGDLYR
jgi:hypothetical protein